MSLLVVLAATCSCSSTLCPAPYHFQAITRSNESTVTADVRWDDGDGDESMTLFGFQASHWRVITNPRALFFRLGKKNLSRLFDGPGSEKESSSKLEVVIVSGKYCLTYYFYSLPLTIYCPLLIKYCLLLTTYYLLLTFKVTGKGSEFLPHVDSVSGPYAFLVAKQYLTVACTGDKVIPLDTGWGACFF